jgi:hypothetical protein
MFNLFALLTLIFSSFILLRLVKFTGIIEKIIYFFCIIAIQIVIIGFVLSQLNQLGNIKFWSLSGSILLALVIILVVINKNTKKILFSPIISITNIGNHFRSMKHWFISDLSLFEKLILTPLITTVVLISIRNLAVIIFSAPNNWDSMTYHLARVAYYIQYNNLGMYDANYWAQVTHPTVSPLLLLFTYLVSGRNENLTQLVQFISYWISILSIYEISWRIGKNKKQSLFAAAISALLVNWIMESTTTQNDLMLTAFIGVIVFSLFAYNSLHEKRYLVFAAIGIGLSIGVKETAFIPLLCVAFIVLYIFLRNKKVFIQHLHNLVIFLGLSLLSVIIFAVPSGYIQNYRYFSNPIGPEKIRNIHSFEGESFDYIVRNGSKNALRYGFNFLTLDGLYPNNLVNQIQKSVRFIPKEFFHVLDIDLEFRVASIEAFSFEKKPSSAEDTSYLGIFGFGLIWIAILFSLIGVIKSKEFRILASVSLIYFLVQAYIGPYDPWRGRYFITWAIFAVPIASSVFHVKNRFFQAYLLIIVIAGCISGISASIFQEGKQLFTINTKGLAVQSIFSKNRIEQLTSNNIDTYEPLMNYEEIVPLNAVVAIYLDIDSYEYPLFGKYLTRTIIPFNSFLNHIQPIPTNAQYLLYDDKYSCGSGDDTSLGNNWFLRELQNNNRNCP